MSGSPEDWAAGWELWVSVAVASQSYSSVCDVGVDRAVRRTAAHLLGKLISKTSIYFLV